MGIVGALDMRSAQIDMDEKPPKIILIDNSIDISGIGNTFVATILIIIINSRNR